MRLPNAEQAEIPELKLTGYLLSRDHRYGRAKAAFFLARGFDRGRPEQLAAALRAHALAHEVVAAEQTLLGMRYRVEGAMPTPDGSAPGIRTVWFIESGETIPRFVTAYPLKQRGRQP